MKKFVKLLIIAVLAMVTALSMIGCTAPGGSNPETGLLYKKIGGVYTIYDYVDDGTGKTELNIADEIKEGITELRIKANAFNGDNNLVKITVPSTVTLMDKGAFAGMKKLQELVIPFVGMTAVADAEYTPEDVEDKSIGTERTIAHLFGKDYYDAGSLVTINYDANASAETCYMPVSLKKIVVAPSQNYTIPMYAFSGLKKQVAVEMNDKVVGIGEGAFKGCTQLQTIVLPNSVTKIYASAFENCSKLSNITFGTGVEVIGEKAFKGTALTNVTIPASVTKIENYCFANSAVKNVTLSDNVNKIGHYAFFSCEKLEKVFTSGVESIGVFAFAKCKNLTYFGGESAFAENTIRLNGATAESTSFMIEGKTFTIA